VGFPGAGLGRRIGLAKEINGLHYLDHLKNPKLTNPCLYSTHQIKTLFGYATVA